MKDKEFSGGGREFSSPGQEFSRPVREGAFQPQEIGCSGREYRQENAPMKPKKKRRRLQPAMLTAAALVTSAIVLTSAPAERAHQYPVQELSAEHRAYLDEVWAAMEKSDVDALDLLAKDDMAREIVVDVIAPYARRLDDEYDFVSPIVVQESASDSEYTHYSEGGTYAVYYTGDVLRIRPNQAALQILYQAGETQIIDTQTRQMKDVSFLLSDYTSGVTDSVKRYNSTNQRSDNWYYNATQWSDEYFKSSNYTPVGEWTLIHRSESSNGPRREEARLQGETRLVPYGDGKMYACLENGQVTLNYSDDLGFSGRGTIDVADGYVVRQDDTCLIEHDGERWQVYLDVGDSHPYPFWTFVSFVENEPQSDPPYHVFCTGESWLNSSPLE